MFHLASQTRIHPPADLCDVFTKQVSIIADQPDPAAATRLIVDSLRIAAPIMRRHSWRIGSLREMTPVKSGIYGWNSNYGEVVALRLREPGDRTQYLQLDTVLHCLLHELCHNVYGNHSAAFYDLLGTLAQEAESIKFRREHGVSEPANGRFWGAGQRLGGTKRAPVFRSAGQRLGGSRVLAGLPAAKAAAAAALERVRQTEEREEQEQRLRSDNEACGCTQQLSRQGKNGVWVCSQCNFINCEDETTCESCGTPAAAKSLNGPAAAAHDEQEEPTSSQNSQSSVEFLSTTAASSTWACPRCTFANQAVAVECALCSETNPGFWRCKGASCSSVNPRDLNTCAVCGAAALGEDEVILID